jgi:WD40 repeat protein
MPNVFLSYSRRDQDFVRTLYNALAAAGRDAWVDWEGIPPSAEWLHEVYGAIEAADTFLFVLSPDSLHSDVCAKEVAHALECKKRTIPVVCRDVTAADVQTVAPLAPLAALNWIFFRDAGDFDVAFTQLRFALDTDLAYWHLASRLLTRAQEWKAGDENANLTLRGPELDEAEHWLMASADKEPRPTAQHLEYIRASRVAATSRQRRLLVGVSAALLVALVLSIVSFELYRETRAVNLQLAAEVVAGEASSAMLNNNIDQGLLLSVEASRRDDRMETRNTLLAALEYSPYVDAVLHRNHPEDSAFRVGTTTFSADGQTMLSVDDSGDVDVWNVKTRNIRKHVVLRGVQGTDYRPKVALSPDGQRFAVLDGNGLGVWNATTGEEIAHLRAGGPEYAYLLTQPIAFSPDGRTLASAECSDLALCVDVRIWLWDLTTQKVRVQLPLDFQGNNDLFFAFSPDSTSLAAINCNSYDCLAISQLTVWDAHTGARLSSYRLDAAQGQGSMRTLAFSPDSHTLGLSGCLDTACSSQRIIFWDIRTSRPLDPPIIQHAGRLQTAELADAATLLAFTEDGREVITTASPNTLQLWDVRSHTPTGPPLIGHRTLISSLASSPDGRHFVSGDIAGNLVLWHVTPFSDAGIPLGNGLDGVSPVVFSHDGATMVTWNAGGDVIWWDTQTGSKVRTLARALAPTHGPLAIASLAVSNDGHLLAVGSDTGRIVLWDVLAEQSIGVWTTTFDPQLAGAAPADALYGLQFSPDGHYLVARAGFFGDLVGHIHADVWAVATQTPIQSISSAPLISVPGERLPIAFSPNGQLLAVGSVQRVALYTAASKWQQSAGILGTQGSRSVVQALAFSPDGQVLGAVTSDGVVTLWEVKTGRVVHVFQSAQVGGWYAGPSVTATTPSLMFSPTGPYLLVCDGLHMFTWDLHAGALLARPFLDLNGVLNAVLSPDGMLVAEAQDQGSVVVRAATEAGWQAQACTIANRNLTLAEWQQFFGSETYRKTCPDLPGPA